MPESFFLLVIVIVLAISYDFINGFHDTANSIATVVSTRVMSPRVAILMSAGLNFVGALTGQAVAKRIGAGIVDPNSITQITLIAALIGATTWDLYTWWHGIPSSSSHALIGGIVGASIATGTGFVNLPIVNWAGIEKVAIILVVSPIVGFLFAFLIMTVLLRIFFRKPPTTVRKIASRMQIVSAAFMAYSHGNNDAQKNMGVVTMALVSYYTVAGHAPGWLDMKTFHVPIWVALICAISMGLGTSAGGWKIIRTMGTKIVQLNPLQGFAAEAAAATVIETASRVGFPVSTTHTISGSIMGVGATRRLSAVRWGVAGNIMTAWLLTIPASSFVAFVMCKLLTAIATMLR